MPALELKDLASLAVGGLALSLSVLNYIRTSRVSDRQFVIQFTQDAHKWSAEVLGTFIEVTNPNFNKQPDRSRVLSERASNVSILWDSGRFLFPNARHQTHGRDKEDAYQGYRPPVLDVMRDYHGVLVADAAAIEDSPSFQINSQVYVNIRRKFVSEVQKITGTRLRYDLVQDLIKQ